MCMQNKLIDLFSARVQRDLNVLQKYALMAKAYGSISL